MSRIRRALIGVAALGLAVPLLQLSAPTSTAAAPTCDPANAVAGDLNSDGVADVVVGVPDFDGERGAIDILFSDGTRSFRTAASLGLSSNPGDRFGASVATADVNDDGCDDLAVGAPGYASSAGRVTLLFGHADHTLTTGATLTGPAAHGSLGAQVLLLTTEKLTATGYVRTGQQLVASAPTADDGTAWEAGQVIVQALANSGAFSGGRTIITQNSPGVPGTSENGDRFGTALAGQGRTIVIGTPNEAVGSRSNAGSVTLLSARDAAPTGFAGVAVEADRRVLHIPTRIRRTTTDPGVIARQIATLNEPLASRQIPAKTNIRGLGVDSGGDPVDCGRVVVQRDGRAETVERRRRGNRHRPG